MKNRTTKLFVILLGLGLLTAPHLVRAQQPTSVLKFPDGMPLSSAEISELGDPLFKLLLKDHANIVEYDQILSHLSDPKNPPRVFVVSENIRSESKTAGPSRRAVVELRGQKDGIALSPNIMLAVTLSPDSFPMEERIEAWGWDDSRGRYNYYVLDRTTSAAARPSWQFVTSSADLAKPENQRGFCLQCHLDGGPIMKELKFPWNNWHSNQSRAHYLEKTTPANQRWEVAENPHLKNLAGAEELEKSLISAIRNFNGRQLASVLDAGGKVDDAKKILAPIFRPTTFNLLSASQKSGLHLSDKTGPSRDIVVPAPFFLNSPIIGGQSGPPKYDGLGIEEAKEFGSMASITKKEYEDLIARHKIRLGGLPGDTEFAWLVPEVSHSDNDWIDTLLKKGIVNKAFVAAVLAIDLENPFDSKTRAALLKFVPDSFTTGQNSTELIAQTVANLEHSNPVQGSVEADFLSMLKNNNGVTELRARVISYRDREKRALGNVSSRQEHLDLLLDRAVARRQQVLSHPEFRHLDETRVQHKPSSLLPMP